MTATFRTELHITCDAEECRQHPRSEVILDNADVHGKTTLAKLRRVAKGIGWKKIGELWLCPECRKNL